MTTKFLALRWTSMRKRIRNIVIFAPLKSQSFKVSAAGHGVVGGSSTQKIRLDNFLPNS